MLRFLRKVLVNKFLEKQKAFTQQNFLNEFIKLFNGFLQVYTLIFYFIYFKSMMHKIFETGKFTQFVAEIYATILAQNLEKALSFSEFKFYYEHYPNCCFFNFKNHRLFYRYLCYDCCYWDLNWLLGYCATILARNLEKEKPYRKQSVCNVSIALFDCFLQSC